MEMLDKIFRAIGEEWMLVGAHDGERSNMMTASWGGFGVLWGKKVCFVFVRPTRYTYDVMEKTDNVSLSFFGGNYRSALAYCGKASGRNEDKIKGSGLTARVRGGFLSFDEAKLTVFAKKLFCSDFVPENFLDEEIIKRYYDGDTYHRMYVCEVVEVREG